MSKREHTEIFITLIASWIVYALCQGDFIIPLLAILIILPSYLKQLFNKPFRKSFIGMSWRALISISIVLGGLWRNFVVPPDIAVSFIPIFVPALQTASIFVSLLAWYHFEYQWRKHYLKFLPWFTVALSINVPFNVLTQLVFWFFCFLSVGIMLGHLYFPLLKEQADAIKKSPYKNPFIYTYPIFLAVMALVLFSVLVKSIKFGDDFFMHLIQDYVAPRHFGLFDSTLNLSGSGVGRVNVKPILEIDRQGDQPLYLKGQVFEEYENGVWKAPLDVPRESLPTQVHSYKEDVNIVMYEYLSDIIPAPNDVVAMNSKGAVFERDLNGIIFNPEKKIPKITLFIDPDITKTKLRNADFRKLTKTSPLLRTYLKGRVDHIVGETTSAIKTAYRIEEFFRKNFEYNLYVDFRADDRGLLYMIDLKQPAYCSYFASAMTLMLRERGIPARMVAGFLATEVSNFSEDKFIVRGRDAHAWVEALLPAINPQTSQYYKTESGNIIHRWIRFDPTPSDSRLTALAAYSNVHKIADWMWCSQKRWKAMLLDIETKTLVRLLFVVIIALVLEEIFKKYILSFFKNRKEFRKNPKISFLKKTNPYWSIYESFEQYLEKKLSIERKDSETDGELLERLLEIEEIPEAVVIKIDAFLKKYHAARFGNNKEIEVKWEK